MATEDVLERADRWATGELPGNEANRLIFDLSTAIRSARERIAELEECVRVANRAVAVGNESIARVDRILASWHKVFPSDDPVIARRMVEDRAKAESAQRIAELEREWDFAMNGADRLRERLAAAKDGTDKAIELIQRWGCECEPQIGFFCGPCRAVELIDAAMWGEGDGG